MFRLSNSTSNDIISYRQLFPYVWMVNNPILYTAIGTLFLVALPCFIIVSSVSGIVCLAVPAAVCILILCFLGAIIIAQCAQ